MSRSLPVVVGVAVVGVALVGVPAAEAAPTPVCTPSSCTVTFAATGLNQSFTVPAGVTQVTVTADGAQGGGALGGEGGQSVSMLTVTPGQVLEVVVGTQNGFNGG
ncbi:MAG: hypothetical protein M3O32_20585, partial [Actinomycetota bacterium]|nr:hypothetical protein [Actinomycetota bacterium]